MWHNKYCITLEAATNVSSALHNDPKIWKNVDQLTT